MSLRRSTFLSTIAAVACVVVMIIVIVTNVNGLTASVKRRSYNYLHDVSNQSAQVVDERFAGRIDSLKIIGNSLALATVVSDEEFLGRKLALSEFDALAYVRLNGESVMVDRQGSARYPDVFEEYADSEAFQQTLQGQITAGFYGDYVAFMVPIAVNQNAAPVEMDIRGIMIGIRTKESLQNLLVNDAFGGKGFTFIIDQYNEILTEPMDEENFKTLSDLVGDLLNDPSAQEVFSDTSEDGTREYTLTSPDGTNLLIDYQPLNAFNWALATVVDENFLVETVNMYVMRIIVTLVVLAVIFSVLLVVMIMMQRRYQKRFETVAFADSLTGGMSFVRFRMLAEPLIEKSDPGTYALATLNVKRLKVINRLGGSQEGDDLLRRIYDVLQKNMVGPNEMAAHNTADNFVMLLDNTDEEVLHRRLVKIAKEIEALPTVAPVHVSQGVYVLEDPDLDFIVFLDRSNTARISENQEYQSTCVFYDDEFVRQQEERMRMVSMIEEGLANNEFSVYLQPKVSPTKEVMLGAEALVRWNHPTRGMIGPNIFIPLCERYGLICDLDLYVFDKVCKQLRAWRDKGWNPPPVSVNVSGMHLKDLDFVKRYRQIADKHGVDPSMIELELTESIMFSDLETMEARSVIDAIHEFGFRCSMDDFGSGYSALGLLTDLPIDCIKLDRSFFVDCIGNPRAQTVIATIMKLARELDITTVAEGIETQEQVDMLKTMDCDMIQGFYYSRPLPMDQFAEMAFMKHTVFDKPRD